MISFHKKPWRRVAWFVAGLFSTLLFAGVSSVWQSATAFSNHNPVEIQQSNSNIKLGAWSNQAFEEVAASHLEPNFFQ